MLDYVLTDKMINVVAEISEKARELELRKEFETKPYLKRANRIKSIQSTLALDGIEISEENIRKLTDNRSIKVDPYIMQQVKDTYAAYEVMDSVSAYSIEDMKKIHIIMTYMLSKNGGQIREEAVEIGRLFQWMNDYRETVNMLVAAVGVQVEILAMEPFAEANGRMARLWQMAMLKAWKPIYGYVPVETLILENEKKYDSLLKRSVKENECTELMEFGLELLSETLSRMIAESENAEAKPSEYVRKLTDAMVLGVPYTASDILELLGLRSKETLRAHYLDPAIERGLVVMTLPDKPTSRNQRYIKK